MSEENKRVLLVDDDETLLQGLVRVHRKNYQLTTASGSAEGLELIERDGPFAVVVSDFNMPGMTGTEFLSKVKEIHPDSVRIMLTGSGESQTAIDAINRGEIFRFFNKPCRNDLFRAGVDLALEQYRLINVERTLLEKTFRGSVRVLADVLSLVSPHAFGRAVRVQGFVQQLVMIMQLPDSWRYETAALLSQIGQVAIPQEVLDRSARGEELTADQTKMMQRHPGTARQLLTNIPRLEEIAEMIGAQDERFEGSKNKQIPLGARILKLALDFDALVNGGTPFAEAISTLRARADWYDPQVLEAALRMRDPGQDGVIRTLAVQALRPGMIFEEDVLNNTGGLVVRRGQEITTSMLERLVNYAELGTLPSEMRVLTKADLVPAVS